jgi:ribonuclease HI
MSEIIIFTDGASSGNPGPAGAGVYFKYGVHEKCISKYLGDNYTNNWAELSAVLLALENLKSKTIPTTIYSDSQYAINILTKGWQVNANHQLVAILKAELKNFPNVKFEWVKAHSGIEGNERADMWAQRAVVNRCDEVYTYQKGDTK